MIKLIFCSKEFKLAAKTENKRLHELKIHKDLKNLSKSVGNWNDLFWETCINVIFNLWNLQRIQFFKNKNTIDDLI